MFNNDTNRLDQHFLIDNEVINKFINFCNINEYDVIVEIGCGKGVLTRLIAPICKKLYVIEIDRKLDKYINNIDNIEIIYNNVLDIDIPKCNKIITSLPYSIIEPFILKLINTNFNELYMLMGSTFVNNCLNYNINRLSIIVNSYFNIEKLLDVDKNSFDYPPRTMSSIVKITDKDYNSLSYKYKIYNRLYYYKDKKIKNSLMESLIDINNITKREAKSIINNLNIDSNILEDKFETINNKKLIVLDEVLDNIK